MVYNHVSNQDNSLWEFDGDERDGGIYLQRLQTPWNHYSPAYWKPEVKGFFLDNARMFLREYRGDGLRFDATREIEKARGEGNDGWKFLQHITYHLKEEFPDKYLVAEHLSDHDTVIHSAGFHATWFADAHHEFQRAVAGDNPVKRMKTVLGKDFGYGRNYPFHWNLVKCLLGTHDDCGDDQNGATSAAGEDWKQHRYLSDFFGGRGNLYARAKTRMGWALNVAMPGTPMLFMGSECHMPGYWHDGIDCQGDHRFDWDVARDPLAAAMQALVKDANTLRLSLPALQGEGFQVTHEDEGNNVIAFKRWAESSGSVVLAVANFGEGSFRGDWYGVRTGGQAGWWKLLLCSQDGRYGGWDGLNGHPGDFDTRPRRPGPSPPPALERAPARIALI